jgi:hypothetical protein
VTVRQSQINEWALPILSATSAANGVTVTPANNAYGSYVTLIGPQTATSFVFDLNVNTFNVSGQARDGLARLAFDPAGGTSFAGNEFWSDILISSASPLGGNGLGVSYIGVPVTVPAGWSVGIAMAVNNATVGTGAAKITLYGGPSHSELMPRSGSFVRTFGASIALLTAGTGGTAITPNSAGGKSAWVQCGSAAAEPLFAMAIGIGCNNATMSANATTFNKARGSSTTVNMQVGGDVDAASQTSEALSWKSPFEQAVINTGDLMFARAGGPAAFPTGASVAIYAVGG